MTPGIPDWPIRNWTRSQGVFTYTHPDDDAIWASIEEDRTEEGIPVLVCTINHKGIEERPTLALQISENPMETLATFMYQIGWAEAICAGSAFLKGF